MLTHDRAGGNESAIQVMNACPIDPVGYLRNELESLQGDE